MKTRKIILKRHLRDIHPVFAVSEDFCLLTPLGIGVVSCGNDLMLRSAMSDNLVQKSTGAMVVNEYSCAIIIFERILGATHLLVKASLFRHHLLLRWSSRLCLSLSENVCWKIVT